MGAAAAQTRVIGGHEYRVIPLPGREASDMLIRLIRVVAPGAGVAASSLGFGSPEEAALAGGLTGVVDRLTVEEKRLFEGAFSRTTFVRLDDGREPQLSEVFDVHFQGDMGSWVEWMAFCLEVNFAGFFRVLAGKLGDGMAKARAIAASKSTSPTGATGVSGGS